MCRQDFLQVQFSAFELGGRIARIAQFDFEWAIGWYIQTQRGDAPIFEFNREFRHVFSASWCDDRGGGPYSSAPGQPKHDGAFE